jgi:tRNA(fMet)-specific endonuclease VapC
MITAKLVLDTNVISYLFREKAGTSGYWALVKEPAGITVITLAELYFGAALDEWGQEKLGRLDTLLRRFFLLPTSAAIAEICGNVRAERYRVGRPIELADAWIAATALWFDVPVVTHDRDLERIPGLQVLTLHDNWQVRDSDRVDVKPSASLCLRDVVSHEDDPMSVAEHIAYLRKRDRDVSSGHR